MSPPSQGVWIEISSEEYHGKIKRSPPSQGVWIEIYAQNMVNEWQYVTPLTGGVD